MSEVLRALVYDGEVSLTVADTTAAVKKGIQLHTLTDNAALLFARALSVALFQGSALKESRGELSFSIRGDGVGGELCVSVDEPLHVRGYLQDGVKNARFSQADLLGKTGALTVIRQDGYSRPFVGSSPLVEGDIDAQFEEYYRISEQLPTRLLSYAHLDEKGEIASAGVIALQPLPFALQKTLDSLPDREEMQKILLSALQEGLEEGAIKGFGALQSVTKKSGQYRCRCSKEYLGEVLVSLGERELRDIVKEEGAVRIHCQYCNRDYEFFDGDVDILFPKDGQVS